jgi:ABC-type enterochelin transport system substrate-binding protein
MDSRKAYEMMKEDYIDVESRELCNQIERQLERVITYDNGMLDDMVFNKIKAQAIKLLKEWHL